MPTTSKNTKKPSKTQQNLSARDQKLMKFIESLPVKEQEELLQALIEDEQEKYRDKCRNSFLTYVKSMWPSFINGEHHAKMANVFERIANGTLKRAIINMPPRHTKSEFASYLLPSWFLGRFPDKQVIQCSNTSELASGFGRKVRNLVDTEEYRRVFPNVSLAADSKAANRWNTSAGGKYFAIGVSGTVTGIGADLLIIDDPHSEQEATSAITNPDIYNKVTEWYMAGPRQRLQPGGAIVIVMTRWSIRDLCGQVLKKSLETDGDQWEVINLPAILPNHQPLWPEFWTLKELETLKEVLPLSRWNAQYQQNPVSEEGAIIKREWWKKWPRGQKVPQCEMVIQSWDTAYMKNETADYSACTTWGVFYRDDNPDDAHIIMLDALKDRIEFPALKKLAYEMWEEWKPDAFIVEAKAAGAPLIAELRMMGIPVQAVTPTRGNDKHVRLNSIADLFSSGKVWYPEGKRWAEEVIEDMASFPFGEHDDLVDAAVYALIRFRKGGFVRLGSDYNEYRPLSKPKQRGYYTV